MTRIVVCAFDAARDAARVRELFVRVTRELAPSHLREAFERYIALARRTEIDRIADYYAGPRRGLWVAQDARATLLIPMVSSRTAISTSRTCARRWIGSPRRCARR